MTMLWRAWIFSLFGLVWQTCNNVCVMSFGIQPSNAKIDRHGGLKLSSLFREDIEKKMMKIGNMALSAAATDNDSGLGEEYDVVVIGSGIGGLSAAAMLSLYGYSVAVLESHYAAGGCAHGFVGRDRDGNEFHFDTGPSFFSGLNPDVPSKLSNPLRSILDAIEEPLPCIPYTTFRLSFPEGQFLHTPDYTNLLQQVNNDNTNKELSSWKNLMKLMEPLAGTVEALPTAALRSDIGVALTTAPFLPKLANGNPLNNLQLTKPFQNLLNKAGIPKDSFTQRWLDVLCFCLSGLPASGTITAEMAMMMGEFYEPTAIMDCPKGGANAIVDALVRGIEKNGGQIFLNSPVKQIQLTDKKATGVICKSRKSKTEKIVKAKLGVISNLSVWDLYSSGILDTTLLSPKYVQNKLATPVGKSFMHLHLGFRATREELEKLQAHYIHVEDWSLPVDAPDNMALVSIPSVHDDSLAPEGYAVLHIYTPATEDYSIWAPYENKRSSVEYKALKEERSAHLWHVLKEVLPPNFHNLKEERASFVQVGTPLTHKRFLNRHMGSYGPAIVTGKDEPFSFPSTPIQSLFMCGDSTFPGIGVPAVAGSGILAAHSVSLNSLQPQLQMLEKLQQIQEKQKLQQQS